TAPPRNSPRSPPMRALFDPYGLDVDELADDELGEHPAVPRALEAAEWEPGVGLHDLVDEDDAHLDGAGQVRTPRGIRRPDARREPEPGAVHCPRRRARCRCRPLGHPG